MNSALARDAIRHSPLALLLVIACGTLSLSSSAFSQAPAEGKDAPKAKISFSPEGEAKFAEFVKKVAEAKRNLWDLRMKKEIAAVAKVTGLDDAGKKALEEPARKAAELCMEGWSIKFDEYFRRAFSRQPEQIVESLEQTMPHAENYASANYNLGEHPQPTEHAAWTEGLQRTLSPEQAAKWTEVQTERVRVLRKEIGEFLKPNIARVREQQTQSLQLKSAEIKRALALPKERAEKLDALAKTVLDESADEWGKRAERILLSTEDQQRVQIMKSGHFYVPMDGKELPPQRPAWKEGLAKILSPDEMAQLKNGYTQRRQRQLGVLAQLMMAELDEKIAFSATQRERLLPLVERLAKKHVGLLPDEDSDGYIMFSPQAFLAAGASATDQDLEPILDPLQRKRWQEVCTAKNLVRPRPIARPSADKKTPEPPPDPEVFEHSLSDFLHDKSTRERKRVLATMMVKAEDISRAARLSPETFARLQTAARGATEELLAAWNSQIDQTIRGQLRDATPETIKQRLASVQDYYFQRSGALPQNQPVWDATVKNELTPEQRAAWQKEVDERTAYREKTIVAAILVEFDRRNTLDPEQWAKLEPIIIRVLKEYGPDIASMFGYSNSTPWYLQQHTMLMVFAGVPENELRPILTADQWEQWTRSDAFTNGVSYWENVKNNHAQRIKRGQ